MADYLTRLVERTLGLFPTVRPDIPPTFATEAGEPAPYYSPGGDPPPDPGRAARQTGGPSRRLEPALHPGPPERWGEGTPLAYYGDEGPDMGERSYHAPPSTAAGPMDRTGASPARSARSFAASNIEERVQIEHQPAGSPARDHDEPPLGPESYVSPPSESPAAGPADQTGASSGRNARSPVTKSTEKTVETERHSTGSSGRDDDEPPLGPEEYRLRPAPTSPDTAVPDATTGPEGSRGVPGLPGPPPSESPAGPDDGPAPPSEPAGPSESSTRLDGCPPEPSGSNKRPTERSDTGYSDTIYIETEYIGLEYTDTDQAETGTVRGEAGTVRDRTDVTASQERRGAEPSRTRRRAAPPETEVSDRRMGPAPARRALPDPAISEALAHKEREHEERDRAVGRTVGRKKRERAPETPVLATESADTANTADAANTADVADARGGRSGPSGRPVPETPLVPVADPSRTTPAPVLAAPHKREAAREASSPTVRVTIGRVEVRAVAPEPAQPPPMVRPQPALSLDDYLRQRGGGRR